MPGVQRQRCQVFVLLTTIVASACAPANPSAPATPGAASPEAVASTAAAPSASATPRAIATVGPARWSDCGRGFGCTEIRVPRAYDGSVGGYLNISVIRLAASKPAKRIGSLIVNPGGPGASGVEFVREGATRFPDALRQRFDIVGFDPRGVNSSTAVRCIDNLDGLADLDPSPDDAAELEALVDSARDYAAACARRNDALLPYLSTDSVARDLDAIRQAVGDERLTYLGFSYGTLIGSTYADLYPDRIRAMAFDGAIDQSLDLEQFRSAQGKGFEAALKHFLADCSARTECTFHENGKSAKAFDALMASIDRRPLPATLAHDNRLVGPGLASASVLGALYSKSSWPLLAASLALAKGGDGSLMLVIADPFRGRKPNGAYSNLQDAYTANTCLDYAAPTKIATFTRWGKDLAAVAPHFAELVAYNDLACAFWSVPAERTPQAARGSGAPPIVVVGSTGDPATPYDWAVALADQLESGVLVTRNGEGHTGYLDSTCVSKAVDAYLLTLKAPRDGLTCD